MLKWYGTYKLNLAVSLWFGKNAQSQRRLGLQQYMFTDKMLNEVYGVHTSRQKQQNYQYRPVCPNFITAKHSKGKKDQSRLEPASIGWCTDTNTAFEKAEHTTLLSHIWDIISNFQVPSLQDPIGSKEQHAATELKLHLGFSKDVLSPLIFLPYALALTTRSFMTPSSLDMWKTSALPLECLLSDKTMQVECQLLNI